MIAGQSVGSSTTPRCAPLKYTSISLSTGQKMVLPTSVWVEVEAAAVEVDRRLEVLPVAEAAGGVPDPLDLRVQAFGRRVGDPVAQVGEDVRQVRFEHPRFL